jgi:hypothetical protein
VTSKLSATVRHALSVRWRTSHCSRRRASQRRHSWAHSNFNFVAFRVGCSACGRHRSQVQWCTQRMVRSVIESVRGWDQCGIKIPRWNGCIGWGVDSLSKRRVHREAVTMVGWWWWWLRFRDEGGGGSTPEEGRQTASSGADGEPSGPGPGDSPGPSGCAIVVELPSPQSPMSPLPFAIEIVEVNCKISFKQGQGQI